jgi:tetratricopeptide (TPR) repeat protein
MRAIAMQTRHLISGLLMSLLASELNAQNNPVTSPPGPAACAVAVFRQTGNTGSTGYLGEAIQQSLVFELGRTRAWPLAERARLTDVLAEADLKAAGVAEGRSRALVGAELVILGEYEDQGGLVIVHARLVEAANGIVRGQARWSGHISGLADEMSRRVVSGLANRPVEEPPLPPAMVVLFEEACRALRDGNADRTIELCNRILDGQRGHIPTLMLRGYAELRKKGFADRARRDFNRIIEIDPANVAARMGLAQAELDGDERAAQRALIWMRQVLERQAANGEGLYLTGVIHERLKNLDAAIEAGQSSVRELPKFGPGWALIARVHLARGESPPAIKAARRAVECDNREPEYWMILGDAHQAGGETQQAEESFRKALGCNPPPIMKDMLDARLKRYK